MPLVIVTKVGAEFRKYSDYSHAVKQWNRIFSYVRYAKIRQTDLCAQLVSVARTIVFVLCLIGVSGDRASFVLS